MRIVQVKTCLQDASFDISLVILKKLFPVTDSISIVGLEHISAG